MIALALIPLALGAWVAAHGALLVREDVLRQRRHNQVLDNILRGV